MSGCLICERVAFAKQGRNPHLIAEMEHSYFVVGDHQFHRGYALVLLKEHVREPFDLPDGVQGEHFVEVMRAAKALQATFDPWKLNFSCYGNAEPHVHWHLVPRYKDDPHPGNVARRRPFQREHCHCRAGTRNRLAGTRKSRVTAWLRLGASAGVDLSVWGLSLGVALDEMERENVLMPGEPSRVVNIRPGPNWRSGGSAAALIGDRADIAAAGLQVGRTRGANRMTWQLKCVRSGGLPTNASGPSLNCSGSQPERRSRLPAPWRGPSASAPWACLNRRASATTSGASLTRPIDGSSPHFAPCRSKHARRRSTDWCFIPVSRCRRQSLRRRFGISTTT